jgi:hypothetical protein
MKSFGCKGYGAAMLYDVSASCGRELVLMSMSMRLFPLEAQS